MDDLLHRPRARRLALITLLTCATPALVAEDKAQDGVSFRSLIQQGLDPQGPSAPETNQLAPETKQSETELVDPVARKQQTPAPMVEGKPVGRSLAIGRPQRFIEDVDPIADWVEPFVPLNQPAELSTLIRQQVNPIVVPKNSYETVDRAAGVAVPQVHRITTQHEKGIIGQEPSATAPQSSDLTVQLVHEPADRAPSPVEAQSTSAPVESQVARSVAPPEQAQVAVEGDRATTYPPSELKPLLMADSLANASQSEPHLFNTDLASTPTLGPSSDLELPVGSVLERSAPVSINPPVRPDAVVPPSPIASAQAIRLRESARLSLLKSQQRLQRRATHSAKSYANEALRTIVAMQDSDRGGNQHAQWLAAGLDAIRESRDFSVQYGVIDPSALQRMVAVHETQVLKERDLEHVSATEATEAYLNFAREHLIQAAAGAGEASGALTILGRVERETAAPEDAHALAVAMTMQQAAVAIAPHSMLAYRELGITLSRQGLMDDAADSLRTSVSIRPTRTGYQKLLDVSRRRGDVDTAYACVAALKSGDLQTEIPVRTISPERFAATHRPDPASMPKQKTVTDTKGSQRNETETVRVSFRSMFPFGGK